MPNLIDILIAFFQGIVEGITEWLPISSTGHMILVNEFLNISSDSFFTTDVFLYVIQLGAILAIATIYFKKLNPFAPSKTEAEKKSTRQMWFKVIVACVPAAVIGLLLNDFMENFETPYVIAATLIIYGIGFIVIESIDKKVKTTSIDSMSYKTAVLIGAFQVLSIVPGTSRSGSTILGAITLGCSREIAAEFSFFLAVPVMFGVSFLKLVTCDIGAITAAQWILLGIAMAVAYGVSMIAVKFLTGFVKKHDFKIFGWYRIALGIIVLIFFTVFR